MKSGDRASQWQASAVQTTPGGAVICINSLQNSTKRDHLSQSSSWTTWMNSRSSWSPWWPKQSITSETHNFKSQSGSGRFWWWEMIVCNEVTSVFTWISFRQTLHFRSLRIKKDNIDSRPNLGGTGSDSIPHKSCPTFRNHFHWSPTWQFHQPQTIEEVEGRVLDWILVLIHGTDQDLQNINSKALNILRTVWPSWTVQWAVE